MGVKSGTQPEPGTYISTSTTVLADSIKAADGTMISKRTRQSMRACRS
jgi:hypothetical protein